MSIEKEIARIKKKKDAKRSKEGAPVFAMKKLAERHDIPLECIPEPRSLSLLRAIARRRVISKKLGAVNSASLPEQ